MDTLTILVILAIVASIGGIVWNHFTGAAALAGVSFIVALPPSVISAALDQAHNRGAKGALRHLVDGVEVVSVGANRFVTRSKFGDEGEITITADPAGSLVTAHATSLYAGAPPRMLESASGGIWALSVAITHGLYRLVGVCPGAGAMKRWQLALERRVTKEIAKARS